MLSLTPELLVEDIQQTVDWYTKILGFEVLFLSPEAGTPTFARIKQESVEIMLFRRTEFSHEIPSFATQSIGGSFVLYLELSDVKALWDRIKDQVQVTQPLHVTDYGSTEFTIQDCNGYHLMFGQRNE